MTDRYSSPPAFRDALKDRIKRRANERGMLYSRYRQLVLFERFASRVYEACGDAVVTKGGLAMELRLERARTTKDVDVNLAGDFKEEIDRIRRVANAQNEFWLSFEVEPNDEIELLAGDQMVYEGYRVGVQAKIGGENFGDPFHLDVSTGAPLTVEPEREEGTDLFLFVDEGPIEHRVYPRETHVAEKLHAWSLPRDRPNSRLRDLVDIGLFALEETFEAEALREAVVTTFRSRDTHEIPEELPEIPSFWHGRYDREKDEHPVPWDDLDTLTALVADFLEPIFADCPNGVWKPESGEWE